MRRGRSRRRALCPGLRSWPGLLRQRPWRLSRPLATAATGFPSPLWGGARGGGNPLRILQFPPPCPSPTSGQATLRHSSRFISTLELLVPPLLEGHVILGHVAVVEIDQGLYLLGREA